MPFHTALTFIVSVSQLARNAFLNLVRQRDFVTRAVFALASFSSMAISPADIGGSILKPSSMTVRSLGDNESMASGGPARGHVESDGE